PYPNTAYDGFGAAVAPAATCSCTCGDATGMKCDPPLANYFKDANCTLPCGVPNQPITAGPSCTPLGTTGCAGTHFTLSAPTVSGGTCPPQASSNVPPWGFRASARLCSGVVVATADGCARDRVCTPATALPFAPGNYCIARPGSWPCPPAYSVA